MEYDLSEPIKHCTEFLDSDSEGDEERAHDCDELYRYPWEESKNTLKNIFSRLNPTIKETRDKLGPYIYTKRVSASLGWVLMKSCSGRWYFGQWNKKTRKWEGVGVYADKISVYEGYWKNDKPHWKGREIYNNGDCYEGDWYDGECHGKGTYLYTNGNHAVAGSKNGKFHGPFYLKRSDGLTQESAFVDGKERSCVTREGNEVLSEEMISKQKNKRFISVDIDFNYKGECDFEGNPNGFGVFFYANGDKYEGEFKNGFYHGLGCETFATGEIRDGIWRDNKMNGKGTHVYANGDVYVGDFKDDIRSGQGKMTWANGEVYSGDWKNDLQRGHGSYEWPNGSIYFGEWRSNERYGNGKMTWYNGLEYTGDWKKDKIWGTGTITLLDKSKHRGRFEAEIQHKNGKDISVVKCVLHKSCKIEIKMMS